MMALKNFPECVLIEKGCEGLPYTQEILSRLTCPRVEIISDVRAYLKQIAPAPSFFSSGKRTLLLMKNRGRFIKRCPGTRHHLCCLYLVLHHAAGCPLDCSYCILQAYLNNPFIVFYVNVEDMLAELRDVFSRVSGTILRIGTGEFTDSLALEHITHTTRLLMPLLGQFPNVFLELKTKTADIDSQLACEPRRRIIFSWSLNPEAVVRAEETGTAPLEERLAAASKAQSASGGHPIAFHFDPLLRFPGWEEAYTGVVRSLADAVDLSRVLWVSMGTFRFPQSLKHIMEERFPQNRLVYDEFIRGEDGKMRYFKPLRREMYAHVLRALRAVCPDVFTYLCMERDDVWDEVYGFHPENNLRLKKMLDERCLEALLSH
jgi:spore photoproduct lyase